MKKTTIGVLVGSLRRDSFSKKIAHILMGMMPEWMDLNIIDIGSLALFNQDFELDGATPPEWETFREAIAACDGFVFVTPEYNRSFPAVLKNALDVGSRPYCHNRWSAKPAMVVSVSPGGLGGFGANHHLRQVMTFVNLYVMQQPEVYLGDVMNVLDKDGALTNDSTKTFLQSVADSFAGWVQRFAQ